MIFFSFYRITSESGCQTSTEGSPRESIGDALANRKLHLSGKIRSKYDNGATIDDASYSVRY